jgi:hypothetical protein
LRPNAVHCRGAKPRSHALRDTFSDFALIQRCQAQKGRNIAERFDPSGLWQFDRRAGGASSEEKSFCRLNGHKKLPTLRAALLRHEPLLLGDKLIFPQKNLAA